MSFSKTLYDLRTKKGLSQKQLADLAGVSQTAIYHWEKGVRTPKIEQLDKLSNALGVHLSELLTFDTLFNSSDSDIKNWVSSMSETKSDKLNEFFGKLNAKGQEKAIEQVEMLTKIPEYRKEESPDQEAPETDPKE